MPRSSRAIVPLGLAAQQTAPGVLEKEGPVAVLGTSMCKVQAAGQQENI